MEDGDWYRTWAFPLNEKNVSHEGDNQTRIHGSLKTIDGYPGCPHCGAKAFPCAISATKSFAGTALILMLHARGAG